MIPKIIHYCWFGRGSMPELAIKCLDSWKENLSEYEIMVWCEDNFDINCNKYVKEAYESKKYAFVSDYARLHALYHHGGIYLDTDVEVLKSLNIFLEHKAFIGCEDEKTCGTGTIGAEKGSQWISNLLAEYEERVFVLPDGSLDNTPNTKIITDNIIHNYNWMPVNKHQVLKDDLNVYPVDVFCAKDWRTNKVNITDNTYTVHHFSASWHSNAQKIKHKISILIGPRLTRFLMRFISK